MSTGVLQIAERAKEHQGEALTNLHQYIDETMLTESFMSLNKNSSPGVDKRYWHNYSLEASTRLPELLTAFKSGSYHAPPIRRVYIPKGHGGKRPLGIPTIEDKILQESVRRVMDPVYEGEFKPFSYGFRRGYSAHKALEYMFGKVSFEGMHYIIDADIKDYFGSIDHVLLREFLDRRVKDGVIRKMIDKWLKAGIMEGEQLSYPKSGTPQGGLITPRTQFITFFFTLIFYLSDRYRMANMYCFAVYYYFFNQ